jgi:hypothetical protein
MPEADHAARLAALKTRLGHSTQKARRFNLIPIMAAAAPGVAGLQRERSVVGDARCVISGFALARDG